MYWRGIIFISNERNEGSSHIGFICNGTHANILYYLTDMTINCINTDIHTINNVFLKKDS